MAMKRLDCGHCGRGRPCWGIGVICRRSGLFSIGAAVDPEREKLLYPRRSVALKKKSHLQEEGQARVACPAPLWCDHRPRRSRSRWRHRCSHRERQHKAAANCTFKDAFNPDHQAGGGRWKWEHCSHFFMYHAHFL